MKRWVSGAMAFVITFSCAQGGLASAVDEVEEVIVEALMDEDAQAAFEEDSDEVIVVAEDAGDEAAPTTGSEAGPTEYEATLGDEDEALAPEADAEPESADAQNASEVVRYARIVSETAEIYAEPEGAAIARLTAGSAVLVLNGDEKWIGVAFNTERGIVTGCVEAEGLYIFTDDETAAYLDTLAQSETIAAYEGDINRPLEWVECGFVEEEANDEAEPEPEDEGAADESGEDETDAAEAGENVDAEADAVSEEAPEEAPAEAEVLPAVEIINAEAAADTGAPAAETAGAVVQEVASVEETDKSSVSTEAAMQINLTELTLGLKETYSGLAITGGSGVTWSSSNEKVAKVDASTGAVKGVKKGSATITAKSSDGQTVSVKVAVKGAPKKIKFSPKKLSIGAAEKSVTLKLKMTKGTASAGTVFTSSNEGVATVDASGVVTSHSAGTAVITARTYNNKKATCKVSVTTEPLPAAMKLPSKVSIGIKETVAQLPVELVPAAGDSQCSANITWSSSNKKIVKVNPNTGAIKAVKKGSATIVAKTENGLKAKCKVTVKKAPKKVALKPASSSVSVGGTVQFSASLPKGTASIYTYTSSDTSVVVIDQNGLATGVAAGKATITVATYNGKKASATLEVSSSDGTGDATAVTSIKSEVSVPSSMEKLGIASYQNEYSSDMTNDQKLEYVIYCAQAQLGKPYVYGGGYSGSDPSGFDCSGLVYWSFRQAGVKLEQSAYKQGHDSNYTKIVDADSLKRGDVICFHTTSGGDDINHTGIYLGNGYFIHASSASSKEKVIVQRLSGDSISSDFYKRHFKWGRRILN